jgi:hypothetical protein
MSVPWTPPPAWGNYTLRDIVEVPAIDPVSLFPATAAWWWPIGLILIIAITGTWRFVQQRRRNRYRREALAELHRLRTTNDIGAIPVLLKATAMQAYGRETVASLYGNEWLEFLADKVTTAPFSEALLQIDYLPETRWPHDQSDTLFDVSKIWIEKHPLPESSSHS